MPAHIIHKNKSARAAFLTVLSLCLMAGGAASAADKPADAAAKPDAAAAVPAEPVIKPGDPVVARVDGQDILRSEVLTLITQQPDQVRTMPVQTIFPMAQEQVILNRILSEKADKANLASDEEVKKLLDDAQKQIIRSVYVERQVKAAMTDKKLKDAYKKLVDSTKNIEEVKARHILVDSEQKAKDIIAQLDKGADFEKLAKDNSSGPSAAQGGELGYFAKGDMIPEFADAAFALKPGQYTKTPVKTQFGWHVIQVEDRRKREAPKFEDAKPQLEAQVRQQIVADLIKQWEKEAKVEKFDLNGDPVKETKSN